MTKISAGLLMYRIKNGQLEFLFVHPGGPFFRDKDLGAWSIPKGEINDGENELEAAKREFLEETGVKPEGNFTFLKPVRQKGGKIVRAWAFEGDCDPQKNKKRHFQNGVTAQNLNKIGKKSNKAVFLDRDGTINVYGAYIHKIEDFKFTPTALGALKKLSRRPTIKSSLLPIRLALAGDIIPIRTLNYCIIGFRLNSRKTK